MLMHIYGFSYRIATCELLDAVIMLVEVAYSMRPLPLRPTASMHHALSAANQG
jgi:hypothetical protein